MPVKWKCCQETLSGFGLMADKCVSAMLLKECDQGRIITINDFFNLASSVTSASQTHRRLRNVAKVTNSHDHIPLHLTDCFLFLFSLVCSVFCLIISLQKLVVWFLKIKDHWKQTDLCHLWSVTQARCIYKVRQGKSFFQVFFLQQHVEWTH